MIPGGSDGESKAPFAGRKACRGTIVGAVWSEAERLHVADRPGDDEEQR